MRMISQALVLLAFALPLTGCSVIGLAIGAASDAHASKEFTRLNPLDDLSEGSPLTLITTQGDTVKGELVGLKEIPEYDKIYRERVSCTPLGDVVLAPQVQVTVVAHEKATLFGAHKSRFEAKVLGFDPGVVRLLPGKSRYSPVLPLSNLDSLLSDGRHSISAAILVGMFEGRQVPFISKLGIRDTLETHWIPCDEIGLIIDKSSRNGAITGFLIGAAVDACFLLGAWSAFHSSWGTMKW
jgi:hypothetical protein